MQEKGNMIGDKEIMKSEICKIDADIWKRKRLKMISISKICDKPQNKY